MRVSTKHTTSVIIVLLPLGSSIPKAFSILSQEVTSWAFLLFPRPENVFFFFFFVVIRKTKDFNIFAVVKYIFNTIWVIVDF